MSSSKSTTVCGLVAIGIAVVLGCADRSMKSPTTGESEATSTPKSESKPASDSTNADEHGHKPGAHGGILVSLGRDSYHVEAVFEKGGVLRLYTLGKDESRVIDIETQTLKGFVKGDNVAEAESFELEAQPQEGDAAGRTSQFVGKLPMNLWGQRVEVTVPNIVISGERFRLGFQSNSVEHDADRSDKPVTQEIQNLYLTPGGIYSEEDIKANGGTTASAKFKGIVSSHNAKPNPGDKICPISMTKANPKFAWVIGGKTYEFCCPPCVDEFVKLAKTKPDEIKEPTDYVKR